MQPKTALEVLLIALAVREPGAGGLGSADTAAFYTSVHLWLVKTKHLSFWFRAQISSPIKKRISNTSVQKTLESGEHKDSAPRNAISKTKLPVCLCMGRTEEAGEVKGGKKKKITESKTSETVLHRCSD